MNLMLTSAAYLFAALAVGVMGFAIQRGATCTVAAVDEVVSKRSFRRLASIFEASLWVLGGLLIAQSVHWLGAMPSGYALGYVTVLGGALLGLGAYVNRACVFGAIARLGSGEWAYAVTPLGFYVGCLSVGAVFSFSAPPELATGSPILEASAWVALAFGALMLWRLARLLLARRSGEAVQGWRDRFRRRVWSPHAATTIIGLSFLFALLLVGAWAYTDVLAELARGMANSLLARGLLLMALFAGALVGGWTAGRFRSTRISPSQIAKCFAGGVLMGWGSLLIPGGNDGLILIGMPLLWPYAWVAFLSMCVAIGLALLAEKALGEYAARAGVE
jgi:toxin CptA